MLKDFKVSVKPDSPNVILFSPSGSPEPLLRRAWLGRRARCRREGAHHRYGLDAPRPAATLTPAKPVTLTWDNGEGVTFRRTFAVDNDYMFTITQEVENKSAKPITLHPYALISRHGHPHVEGLYILHEGLLGVLGDEGLQEVTYKDALEKKTHHLQEHVRLARHSPTNTGRRP